MYCLYVINFPKYRLLLPKMARENNDPIVCIFSSKTDSAYQDSSRVIMNLMRNQWLLHVQEMTVYECLRNRRREQYGR